MRIDCQLCYKTDIDRHILRKIILKINRQREREKIGNYSTKLIQTDTYFE